MEWDVRSHVAVGGPEQGRANGPVDGGAVRNGRAGVAEDGRAVEREGGEVVAEVGVGGGDADGLVGLQSRAEDGRGNATANPAGVHLLKLEEGLVLLWRGGAGHRNWTHTVAPDLPK